MQEKGKAIFIVKYPLTNKLIFLVFIVILIGVIVADKNEPEKQSKRSSYPTIQIGREYYTKDYALLALNKDIYNRLIKLIVAQDKIGVNLLVVQGLVIMIEPHTRIKIIDTVIFSDEVEIRLLDGPHISTSGFMYAGFLEE